MAEKRPVEVAIIGGGCASIAAAFELTRPEHHGKYHVTVYQLGWRLGGKGASGRGPAERIEEHGLHVWQGYYENAFRLLRECYAELGRDPKTCRFADWRDAFQPEPFAGMSEQRRDGGWQDWIAYFPPLPGMPGDPLTEHSPFTLSSYLSHAVALLRALVLSVQARRHADAVTDAAPSWPQAGLPSPTEVLATITRLLKYGVLATTAGLSEGVSLLAVVYQALPLYPTDVLLRFLDALATTLRSQCEALSENDDELRQLWEVIDLVLAALRGVLRCGLLTDPQGFDAMNEYETRDWLRLNGASERSLQSAFLRALYDLVFGYEGDSQRPGVAAGDNLRGIVRMFFTYRGALFWKMRASMGDIVFAPFYEVLKKRGVTFQFFHRLTNVKLVDPATLAPGERPYVEALEFAVQADIKDGQEYSPLIAIRGLPCWPSHPDYSQLVNGKRLKREQRDFESYWEHRNTRTKTLRVVSDFDFVVLGVGLGAIPSVCQDFLARDPRWRLMVERVQTIATQAFQLWLNEDFAALGWPHPQMCVTGFVKPFDTWADMRHLIPEEHWPQPPRAIAYFCAVLPDQPGDPPLADASYPVVRREAVRQNAIRFLRRDMPHFWPQAVRPNGEFRWELLLDPHEREPSAARTLADESRFASQFWTANVNPSDRHSLALPGSARYRISPLDNTYDNLTIAGDWTSCGLNLGCVEAAVMSGRLAAHALSQSPPLADITGYDHP